MSNQAVELKFVGKGPRVVFGSYIDTDETRKFPVKQAEQLVSESPKDWQVVGEAPKGFGKPKKSAAPKKEDGDGKQPPLNEGDQTATVE